MSIDDKFSRRELLRRGLNKGWAITKAGLLVPLGCTLLSQCKKKDKPIIPKTYTITGNISDIQTDLPIDNASIQLKKGPSLISEKFTNPSGDYTFDNISPDDYSLIISEANYRTYEAGTLVVNQTKETQGKLDINLQIIPNSFNLSFFNAIARGYGAIQKFADSENLKFYIYLGDGVTYLTPTDPEKDMAISVIENDIPRLRSDITATVANGRITEGTSPPIEDGWVIFYWMNSGAGHGEILDGNEIKRSVALVDLGDIIGNYREEIGQACSGIRGDSDIESNTIFNDLIPNGIEDYTSLDELCGKIITQRPIGNISPDINPSTYIINS